MIEIEPGPLPVPERSNGRAAELAPRMQQHAPMGEREIGAIVADVWENAEKLVRQELELGLAEIDRRIEMLKSGLIKAVIGGATLYAGILVLLAAAVFGLSEVLEPWLAALIVGGVVTGIGATLSQRGGHQAAESVQSDERTHQTVRAMKEAVK